MKRKILFNLAWLTLIAIAVLTLPSPPAEAVDLAAQISGAPQLFDRLRQRYGRLRNTRNFPGVSLRRSRDSSASGLAAAGPTGA